jgi:type I restriction enzyme R subunit
MTTLRDITVENSAIQWLQELGYSYKHGKELSRDLKKAALSEDLFQFLSRNYSHVPETVLKEATGTFLTQNGMDVHTRNREFHLKLTKGISLSWKDKEGKEYAEHIYPINYDEPEKNSFICSNQVVIVGKNKRIPDLIVYINGLPLIVFEFKNMFDQDTGVAEAHRQIEHYTLDIPQLFDFNAITIISDGNESLHGMYSSSLKWFAPWKSIDGEKTINDQELQLQTLLKGLFPKATLLRYIKHFIFHENHNAKIIKKGAKYHQFHGVNKAVERTLKNIQPHGDGRLGVIWHTQGSGKSISMAILTGILRQEADLKNPTIVVQVDRNDLDWQLYDNFILCKDIVGDVQHAESADELRHLLSSDGGGVIFTTIEKFRLKDEAIGKETKHPVLSERDNIIVLADEAHRTQYGFHDGGYAQNLRRALPNASFLGFTGTPVDSKDADTEQVFGKTIHTYDIKQAVEDGATVPIYYEPKMVPLNIKADFSGELEGVETGNEENNNPVWAAIEDAAGSEERVTIIAKNILEHYHTRIEMQEKGYEGKAMIVCMSRRNCVKMYDALSKLENCPEIAVIMTGNISKDPVAWNEHIRTKDAMKAIKDRFKNPNDPLKMVIVRDMWLTGYDAPCVNTMYIDKIMKGHNLMQAIARVNRVFEAKPSGLIVDFIGISSFLAEATKKYTGGGGEGKPTLDIDEAVEACLNQLDHVKGLIGGLDLETIQAQSESENIIWFKSVVNNLMKDDNTTEQFLKEEKKLTELVTIAKSDERIWEILEEVAIVQKFRKTIRKIKFPTGPKRDYKEKIKDLISKSIAANNIIDLAEMYDLEKLDISIVDDDFQAIVKSKGEENIKLELLRRIINDEIRVRMSMNMARMSSLKEELEKVLSKYHSNSIDSIATIKHLLDIAEQFKKDNQRVQELGLDENELAFYDLLNSHKEKLNQKGPIQDLVHRVVKSVQDNLEIDWTRKENAKSAIRLALKKELKGIVPFSELDQILKEIIEQAEGQFGDWPMVG